MLSDRKPLVFRHVKKQELAKVAQTVLNESGNINVIALTGDLGAGKTTFIKAMGNVLGVHDAMSSPTFALVNEYKLKDGGRMLHFDFYRIASAREAAEIGVDEYFYSGDYCFIEWPEKILSLLPENYAEVRIIPEDEEHRTFELLIHGR